MSKRKSSPPSTVSEPQATYGVGSAAPHSVLGVGASMGPLADILTVLRRERARLFAKYGLKSMAVFGSATRDDFRLDSDVDIMVEFERPIGMEFFDLQQELGNIVSREVDLVMRGAVKPHYMEFIQKDLKYV